jgi:type III secretion protein N (ATPase)
MLDLSRVNAFLDDVARPRVEGRVRSIVGLAIRASIPGVRLGEVVEIVRDGMPPLQAEVVGFELDDAMLVPFGETSGTAADDIVRTQGRGHTITCGPGLLGRVLDGLGQPMDGGPALEGTLWDVMRAPPSPLDRPRITAPMRLGVRALDALFTTGEGQRVGLFAGSGVGKSSLLGQIARQGDADVFVICLIGERGREVREFLEEALGQEGRARSVVVCATSDVPAMVRKKSAYVATAIAEFFRAQGKRVVLAMDSVTRFARAGREVGLAAGEPPVRRGYPPSIFAELPRLLERSGTSAEGSITAFYTVLVEGNDMEEPIADEVRGILDGHIVLSRAHAERGHYPAIDTQRSLSRVMDAIVTPAHRDAAQKLRTHLALYESKRELITLGAYKRGSEPKLDHVLSRLDAIEGFLRQRASDASTFEQTLSALQRVL